MSAVDQKRALNKLKHKLEPFRGLVIKTNSLLTWKKNYYAGIVFAAISFSYLTLWLLDLSFVTLVSLSLLMAVLLDYLLPTISHFFNISEIQWTGDQEAVFEEVCSTLCDIKSALDGWYEFIFEVPKSTMFTIIISGILLALAWIGAAINNLLIMYLITLGVFMWPGFQKKCALASFTNLWSKITTTKVGFPKKKGE